jgi:transposase
MHINWLATGVADTTLLGSSVPSTAHQARRPQSHYGDGHWLARLVYRMLRYGQQYVDKGAEYYEQRNRQQQIKFLTKKAAQLGFRVTPTQA